MPPTSTVITETVLDSSTTSTHPKKPSPALEERTIDINISNIIDDLLGVDYSKVVWGNVYYFAMIHILAVVGIYFVLTGRCCWQTIAFSYALNVYGGLGVTLGAHRLWSHRSYKANFPFRLLVAIGQTIAVQNDIYEWSRDHRVHHKFSETDADPHNAHRGFFFSHMGWLMMRKHPDVMDKGKTVDMSDLLEDPIVYYQKKYYKPLIWLFGAIIPAFIPCYFWNEGIFPSIMVAVFARYVLGLHGTWVVNSFAHWIGSRPYDNTIYPVQNVLVAFLTMGEGWHNYHHVFPYDYRTSEFGGLLGVNVSAVLLDFFAEIGWVYDRKIVPKELIERRMERTGDLLHEKKDY